MANLNEKILEESFVYDFDFTNRLLTGDTLISFTPSYTPDGLTTGAPVLGGGNKIVQVRISGGEAGTLYHTKYVGTTVQGDIVAVCGELLVKEC